MGTLAAMSIVLASLGPVASEENRLIATIDRPAVFMAPVISDARPADQPARLVLSVVAYKPPRDGTVQAAVKVQKNDGESEIGRFGIFPDTEFRAAEPSRAQRFGFPLPKELANDGAVKLEVHLLPVRGDGKDARLEIGRAEIR
jgi:hypothetical protein